LASQDFHMIIEYNFSGTQFQEAFEASHLFPPRK
jgi:hypothetical protein